MNNQSIVGAESLITFRVSFSVFLPKVFGTIRVVYVGGTNNTLRVGIIGDDGKFYDKDFSDIQIVKN